MVFVKRTNNNNNKCSTPCARRILLIIIIINVLRRIINAALLAHDLILYLRTYKFRLNSQPPSVKEAVGIVGFAHDHPAHRRRDVATRQNCSRSLSKDRMAEKTKGSKGYELGADEGEGVEASSSFL